jgi:hypothetical protein
MRVDVMKPVYNPESKYRVTMLAREEWARSPRPPPVVKGLIWFTDGYRTAEGTGAGVYGQSVNRRLSIQAEVYAILACACEIEAQDQSEQIRQYLL